MTRTKFDADFEVAARRVKGAKPIQEDVNFHEIDQHADQEILDELSGIGDVLEQMAWRCGWLTDRLYLNLIANGLKVDYLFVCYYVSVTKLRGQRSANTVKKWALTARFFSEQIARKFHYDQLPFAHFAYAAKWGDLKNPKTGKRYWRDVLEFSWNYYLNSPVARFASVGDLEAEFEGKKKRERGSSSQQGTGSGFVPSPDAAGDGETDDPVVYESVIQFPGERAGVLPDEQIYPLIEAAIQNFTLAISNYIPVLYERHPFLASGLSGIIVMLRDLSARLMNGGDNGY